MFSAPEARPPPPPSDPSQTHTHPLEAPGAAGCCPTGLWAPGSRTGTRGSCSSLHAQYVMHTAGSYRIPNGQASAGRAGDLVALSRACRHRDLGSEAALALPGWVAWLQASLPSLGPPDLPRGLTVRSRAAARFQGGDVHQCRASGRPTAGPAGVVSALRLPLAGPECRVFISQTRISPVTPCKVRKSSVSLLL